MIWHLSYVVCDECYGNPSQCGVDHIEARTIAHNEGYRRQQRDGKNVDICRQCRGDAS